MYTQVLDPVADSLFASALVAAIPLVTLFVLLGGLRVKAMIAGPIALVVAIVVAIAVYGMPVDQALLSGTEGAAFGFFPILWIVIAAVWVYNLTEATGHFDVLRRTFGRISDDKRIQAIIVAFAFGALIEGLAGFGAPVAITSVMLIGLGFSPLKAASLALIGNTAPVAFGSIAVPITTLAEITQIPVSDLGAQVGNQTPILALFVPFVLVFVVDGRRGLQQCWFPALVAGVVFAGGQAISAHLISVELTDIIAALLTAAALVALLRTWKPGETIATDPAAGNPRIAGAAVHDVAHERRNRTTDPGDEVFKSLAPYIIIVAVFAIAQIPAIKDALAEVGTTFGWPGLDVRNADGEQLSTTTFNLNVLSTSGTLMFICGGLTMLTLGIKPGLALSTLGATLKQLAPAIVTVMAVLALAYVMNQSGQTVTLGRWLAGAGGAFAFLSSIVGWLGVAVTGSDTSSNALFGALQVEAAREAGISPTLLAAANSSGGVLGKMISPQNLAIGAAAVGMAGKEGDLFRNVVKWSLIMLLGMAVLVYLQSTVLEFMIVGEP